METADSPSDRMPDASVPLRDGGIDWVFYTRESDVPRREVQIGSWAKHSGYLRLAVTYGAPDWRDREYRSTTTVHLWRMKLLPPTVTWSEVFQHIFTHEPLHHAISRALAEIAECGDQEWVIAKLGDYRWW